MPVDARDDQFISSVHFVCKKRFQATEPAEIFPDTNGHDY